MEKAEFLKHINDLRKLHQKSGSWYQFIGTVNDKKIRLKGFKTWLQIYSVDGVSYSNGMDAKVSEFNEALKAPFK